MRRLKKLDNLSSPFDIIDVNPLKAGKWIKKYLFCQNILLKPYLQLRKVMRGREKVKRGREKVKRGREKVNRIFITTESMERRGNIFPFPYLYVFRIFRVFRAFRG
jgi:hypothetical protein